MLRPHPREPTLLPQSVQREGHFQPPPTGNLHYRVTTTTLTPIIHCRKIQSVRSPPRTSPPPPPSPPAARPSLSAPPPPEHPTFLPQSRPQSPPGCPHHRRVKRRGARPAPNSSPRAHR